MKSKDLGLPFEYQIYPEYFDSPFDLYNANEKNQVIEKLLRKYAVKTVLDMTCGTGAQVFYLAKLGYKVVGSDFSPGLLRIAREKALKEEMVLEFIDGDMRNLQVGNFDAVITIDNAIGHLVADDFELAIRNIHKNLNFGGVFVFDILNLEAMTDDVLKADSDDKMSGEKVATDGSIIYTKRTASIDRENGYLTSQDMVTISRGSDQKTIENNCTLKIYTIDQLKDLLTRNGFLLLEQHKVDAYTFEDDPLGYSILTVAKKI